MGADTWGWNREIGEDRLTYIKRLMNDTYHLESTDMASHDMQPKGALDENSKLKTSQDTYYFSYSSGINNHVVTKQRDIFTKPKKSSDTALNYDLDTANEIVFKSNEVNKST